MWFATIVAGMTVRTELLGVTSIVRALNLRPNLYNLLRKHFHSSAVKLDRLSALWVQAVLRLFPSPVSVNGRLVLVADSIKAPKRGKKMPAVKLLHQQSESNTKPEYIMGHSMQAISLLVNAAERVFAVPLAARIHEGLVWCNADKRTLLDKMLGLLGILNVGVLLAILEAAPEIRVPFRVDSHHSSKLGGKSQGGRRDRNQPYRESPQRECITLDRARR
jgi:hypothetical protein